MMRTSNLQQYYASPVRKVVWITLALLLIKAIGFYIVQNLHLASVIASLWLAFVFFWIYHLFRTPIATTSEDSITLLERLRFGMPNFITLRAGQLTKIAERPRGAIELNLREMGERSVSLKYLTASDRSTVIAALQRLATDSDDIRAEKICSD